MRSRIKQKLDDFQRNSAYYFNTGILSENRKPILEKLNAEASRSAIVLCYFFALLFATYGFTITAYMQRTMPELTIWDNTYPRLLFCVLPCLILASVLKKTKRSPHFKVFLFYASFSLIFLATANIYTWPAAYLWGDQYICALMIGPNALTYLIISAYMSPSVRVHLSGTAFFVASFWVPYYLITKETSPPDLFAFVVGAIFMTIPIGMYIAWKLSSQRAKSIQHELLIKSKASESVNVATRKALFDPKFDYKKIRERKGFYLVFDLRSSTKIKKIPDGPQLIRDFVEIAMSCAIRNGAEIINDRGDGYFLFFGPNENLDLVPDLKDLPNLDSELEAADKRLYAQHFSNLRKFLDEISAGASALENRYKIGPIHAGFATTLATAKYYFLQAEGTKREHWDHDVLSLLDRLEKLSKTIKQNFDIHGSVAVFHPNTRIFWNNQKTDTYPCEGVMDGHESVHEVDYLVLKNNSKFTKAS